MLDPSALISLGKAGRLDLLATTPSYRWHIAPIARGELVRPETRDPVEQFILEGRIIPVEMDSGNSNGMTLLAEWSDRVHPGEAEGIAIALANGWLVALEDLDARRTLDRVVGRGRWINCADMLIDAVTSGSLPAQQAEAVFQSLDVYSSYTKAGVSTLKALMS